MSPQAREVNREQPPSREEYLKSFEKEWSEIHEGKMPETGLKAKGRLERKETCEDVKLKNEEKGIYLVADGVSSANGWFASRETARVLYEVLGKNLDKGIENNLKEALRNGEDPVDRITAYIGTQMKMAVEQSDARIKAMGATDKEFRGSATTLSAAKLVELPDGKGGFIQRMFFTNIGDSRIYVQRKGGRLEQVTRDDSALEKYVERGDIAKAEADMVDQAEDPKHLHPTLRPFARKGNQITKSVGLGSSLEDLGVFYLDLKPGDRFVIVSDGVSDQMLTNQIQGRVDGERDDNRAEGSLQQGAMEMSLDGTHPRSKGDDISALVKTIGERGPSRDYLKQEVRDQRSQEALKQELRKIQVGLGKARQRVLEAGDKLRSTEPGMLQREKLALALDVELAKEAEAAYAYNLEKTQLDLMPGTGSMSGERILIHQV